jgi:hypothetical protein
LPGSGQRVEAMLPLSRKAPLCVLLFTAILAWKPAESKSVLEQDLLKQISLLMKHTKQIKKNTCFLLAVML